MGSAESKNPEVGAVGSGRMAVEKLGGRSRAIVVKLLAQSEDLTPEVGVFLNQVSDALVAVEHSRVVAVP
jgi:hypothetical protein